MRFIVMFLQREQERIHLKICLLRAQDKMNSWMKWLENYAWGDVYSVRIKKKINSCPTDNQVTIPGCPFKFLVVRT